MFEVSCVGDCGFDHYEGEEEFRVGGCSLNFAVHVRRNQPQWKLKMVSAISNDRESDRIVDVLNDHQVDLTRLVRVEEPSPYSRIEIRENGERVFPYYDVGALVRYRLGEADLAVIRESDLSMGVLFGQNQEFFESSLLRKEDRRGLYAADFSDMADFGKSIEVVKGYAPFFEFGFFGLNSVKDRGLIEDLKAFSLDEEKVIVVTLGSEGVVAFDRGEEFSVPPVPVEHVVDTTGAGDSFAASFFSSYMDDRDMEKALAFANQYASRVVQRVGSI